MRVGITRSSAHYCRNFIDCYQKQEQQEEKRKTDKQTNKNKQTTTTKTKPNNNHNNNFFPVLEQTILHTDELNSAKMDRSWQPDHSWTSIFSPLNSLNRIFTCDSFQHFFVPCWKFWSHYLGKAQQPQEQRYPFLSVCAVFLCVSEQWYGFQCLGFLTLHRR